MIHTRFERWKRKLGEATDADMGEETVAEEAEEAAASQPEPDPVAAVEEVEGAEPPAWLPDAEEDHGDVAMETPAEGATAQPEDGEGTDFPLSDDDDERVPEVPARQEP